MTRSVISGLARSRLLDDLRASLLMLLIAALLWRDLPLAIGQDHGLRLLALLDVGRRLFWGLILMGIIAVLAPLGGRKQAGRLSRGLQLFVLVGLIVLLSSLAISLARSEPLGIGAVQIALLFVLLNLLGLAVGATAESGPLIFLARPPLLLELVLPLGWWAVKQRGRQPQGRLPHLRRLTPCLALCLAAGLLGAQGMLEETNPRHKGWELHSHILWDSQKNVTIAALDSATGLAMAATYNAGVVLKDLGSDEPAQNFDLPSGLDITNMGWDPHTRLLYAADSRGYLHTFDPKREVFRTLGRIEGPQFSFMTTSSLPLVVAADGSALWMVVEDGLIVRVGLPDLAIQAEFRGYIINNFVVLDEQNLIYASSINGHLLQLDSRTLQLMHQSRPCRHAAQIAYDAQTDRLFLSAPADAAVVVVDRQSREIAGRIEPSPGCRALRVEPEQRLLFVAGFAPYLEIYDLDGYRLLARISCLPWTRWIVADPRSGRALLTDKFFGLSAYDYSGAVRRGRLLPITLHDPYFDLAVAFGRGKVDSAW